MSKFLTEVIVKELLRCKPDGSLQKRESHTLEFKQDFDWNTKTSKAGYLKSIAAFANKTGGYLIFGVSDSPRRIVGISDSFSALDDATISQALNQYLSPCPDYERDEFAIHGKKVGVIYVHECSKKPIVSIKDFTEKLLESAIYYRYNSKSSNIKSGDLLHLLREAKENETRRWMELISQASSLGIHNAGIFDVGSGVLATNKGNRFVLDERLLRKLQVLDQYSIQKDGATAVRIVGDIDQTGTIIRRSLSIHDDDIIEGFLMGAEIDAPEEYVNAMCYQSSGHLPIYFY